MQWPREIEEARELQKQLRNNVIITPLKKRPATVAGVDAAFSGDRIFAAACLFIFPEVLGIEQAQVVQTCAFPYVPGFLSFREGPAVMAALKKLSKTPDLILCDGQGIAHPQGLGIASHIGVLLDVPAIGCAKSRLVGEWTEPGLKKGSTSVLRYKGNRVGSVLRTRDGVRPLFISPGHKIDRKDAVRFTLACTDRYRIPEPLRCADMLSKRAKK